MVWFGDSTISLEKLPSKSYDACMVEIDENTLLYIGGDDAANDYNQVFKGPYLCDVHMIFVFLDPSHCAFFF